MNCNACSTEDVLPNADKLRGRENWDEWAVRVGRILKRHSLFFVTRIREPHVNSMKGRSDRAMAIICQNCGPGVLAAQEGQCSNAWVMWRRLDFLYSPNHQGTTLNPRDFQARLLHDVHVFNAMFNRRFCQIYGSSCLDGRGSTSIPSAHLAYYDLVFYVYDGWVCRRKEREKEEPRVSLFAIQDELADYVSLMDFSMERWYGIMPPVDMMSGLEPNTRGKNSDFSPSESESDTGTSTQQRTGGKQSPRTGGARPRPRPQRTRPDEKMFNPVYLYIKTVFVILAFRMCNLPASWHLPWMHADVRPEEQVGCAGADCPLPTLAVADMATTVVSSMAPDTLG
ncbi:hypothetical protein VDGD_09814 [Verticillium dahliae]|nr:hypothetical protein VDGD_09814 [Verticillium dahliae]